MKIIFISNYFNHHQKPLSDALCTLTKNNYLFIETVEMEEERLKIGWGMDIYPNYVVPYPTLQDNIDYYLFLINNADVVITGSAPNSYVVHRLKSNKLVFRYSERIYKKRYQLWQIPLRAVKYYYQNGLGKNIYMLCASAYTSSDYAVTGHFKNKCYKWGYFPETKSYDLNELMDRKYSSIPKLLWVGRFLSWKHPEIPIEIARGLKAEGYDFQLDFIGMGELEPYIQKQIDQLQLGDCVHLLGSMSPEQVRSHMEKCSIYLFTSDRNEGWGAVLNESMNSGCAVVASHAIGAAPFLIDHNINGFIYKDGDVNQLYKYVKYLLDNPAERMRLGISAYETIQTTWNATVAAERFLTLVDALQRNGVCNIFKDGPCSKAVTLKDSWI
ncbi:glycosyltransferase [Bilophila wadsworthia]